MDWSVIVGLLAVLSVVAAVLGALLSLATNGLLTGGTALAAIVVLVLLAVTVGGMVLVGRGSARHTDNPDAYW